MKRLPFFPLFVFFVANSTIASSQSVVSIRIDGTINPAAAQFIHNGIEHAYETEAACLVIKLNTPGGLLKSTRVIVSDILTSKVPVVVYVSPGGSQSASAGVFITLAGHIAAIASAFSMRTRGPGHGHGKKQRQGVDNLDAS